MNQSLSAFTVKMIEVEATAQALSLSKQSLGGKVQGNSSQIYERAFTSQVFLYILVSPKWKHS